MAIHFCRNPSNRSGGHAILNKKTAHKEIVSGTPIKMAEKHRRTRCLNKAINLCIVCGSCCRAHGSCINGRGIGSPMSCHPHCWTRPEKNGRPPWQNGQIRQKAGNTKQSPVLCPWHMRAMRAGADQTGRRAPRGAMFYEKCRRSGARLHNINAINV